LRELTTIISHSGYTVGSEITVQVNRNKSKGRRDYIKLTNFISNAIIIYVVTLKRHGKSFTKKVKLTKNNMIDLHRNAKQTI
jgi:hypothetical protein